MMKSNKKFREVLLIEDNETTNYINSKLISTMGIANNITIKKNGLEALEYLNNVDGDKRISPDLIFLDSRSLLTQSHFWEEVC